MLQDLFSLAGRRALVTGASRGLGRALALGLAGSGADVALVARTRAGLEETAREVQALGRRSLVLPADVGCSEAVRGAFDATIAAWGGLEILIANAGTNIRKPTPEASDEDWHAVLRTNLDGAFFCAREAPRAMHAGGRILFIGSVAGLVAIPTGVAYAASKAALGQMSRSLAQEYAPLGINVNCLAPWYVRTELTRRLLDDPATLERVLAETPLGRLGEPRDLVGAAVFLAGPSAAWITGQTLAVDGGLTVSRFAPPAGAGPG